MDGKEGRETEKEKKRPVKGGEEKDEGKRRGARPDFLFFSFSLLLFLTSQGLPCRARGLVQEGRGGDRGREGVEVRPRRFQGRDGGGRGRREGRGQGLLLERD